MAWKRKFRISKLARIFAAVMAGDETLIRRAVDMLSQLLGEVDLESPVYDFDFTDYYREEMGPGLVKQFFSFKSLCLPGNLVRIKRRTAACEKAHRAPDGGRRVNIDPGYWADAKLVLASSKNYSHRIAVGRRVFAEITLRYHKGRLQPLDWTYPDYRTPLALEFFTKMRKTYLEQVAQI